jgi:hypothetical protein
MTGTPVYLIGFAESVATPEVCFSLVEPHARIICFCRRNARSSFNFVEYHEVTSPESDFQRTVSDIRSLIDRFRSTSAAPCDDTALFVMSQLGSSSPTNLTPTESRCDFAMDKYHQIERAAANGFQIIPTLNVTSETDVSRFSRWPAELDREIIQSRLVLQTLLGQLVQSLSVPYGNHLDATREARKVARAGDMI